MANYRCLVLDHDDTVVQSARTVNYPAMVEALQLERPGRQMSYEEFSLGCFRKTFDGMCRQDLQYTEEELQRHYLYWKSYVRTHIPPAYDGLKELLTRFRAGGGLICVSSHSSNENITRDYLQHFGFAPDQIYSYDLPKQLCKPHPYALQEIMRIYGLQPGDLLMVDDMKAGCDMARSCGVPFACAGWSHDVAEIADFMRNHSPYYLNSVKELEILLFGP